MEINDYLAIAKRRWMLLIGVPLLAGLIAVGVLMAAPAKYTATATVNAPALVGGSSGQYTGSQAVTQFVAAFQSTAASTPVDTAVLAATQLQPGQIEDGLAVTQVGGSSAVTITFTSTNNGEPAKVVSTVASATLAQMFDSQVTLAQSRVDDAAKQVAAGNTAINEWGAKNNMVDPTRVYQSQLERLNALQQTQASLKAQGNATAAGALSGTITEVSNQLKGFGPKIAEFNNLMATRDSAQAELTSARQALSQAKTQKTAADPSQVVWVSGQRKLERTDEMLSVGLPVVGAGIFLAIALIAALELLRGNRIARRRRDEEAAAAARAAEPTTVTDPAGVTDPALVADPTDSRRHAGDAAVRESAHDSTRELPTMAAEPTPSEGDAELVGTERS